MSPREQYAKLPATEFQTTVRFVGTTEKGAMLTFDRIADVLMDRINAAELIAIDGLPCAGKSTLANRLEQAFGLSALNIDDFFLPHKSWPADIAPAYPFPFLRVEEFRAAVRALKRDRVCCYHPYDWEAGDIRAEARLLRSRRPLVVEGCSVLDPVLVPLYDLRLFVASDPVTVLAAQRDRDGDFEPDNWRDLYLPSSMLYLATRPELRADFIVTGRGLSPTQCVD